MVTSMGGACWALGAGVTAPTCQGLPEEKHLISAEIVVASKPLLPPVVSQQAIHREFLTSMAILVPKIRQWGEATKAKAKVQELYMQCFTFTTTAMRLVPYNVWRQRSRWGTSGSVNSWLHGSILDLSMNSSCCANSFLLIHFMLHFR